MNNTTIYVIQLLARSRCILEETLFRELDQHQAGNFENINASAMYPNP